MRLNMHRVTPDPQKIPEKVEKVLVIFAWGLIVFPFLASSALLLWKGALELGILLAVISALMGLLGAHLYMNERHSYVEIEGDTIRTVEYMWCRSHESRFGISEIGELVSSNIRYGKTAVPHIRVNDRQGRELFSVYRCAASERVLSELFEHAKE